MSKQFIQWNGFFDFRVLPDGIRELLQENEFIIPDHGIVAVKPGFKFDGASIPKLFWSLVGSPFTGKYQRPALLHDALYGAEIFPRKICDEIFLEYMKEEGVGWWKRNLMWIAVRSFGGFVWSSDAHRAKIQENFGLVILERAWQI